MNAKELAEKLVGLTYPISIDRELVKQAKADGLVIVYGASDDLMEFDGAINDELGAYNGTTAYLDAGGLLDNACSSGDDCPHFERRKKTARTIKAVWCAKDSATWTYQTDIPHETFDVHEGDEHYCRGIVFALRDTKPAAGEAYREQDIVGWGVARNLIGQTGEATRVGQQAKTEEEVRELSDAIAEDDRDAARDAIGDVYVTIVMQAQMWGLSMAECIEAAWNEIKDRKGRMINGVFVKEADLPQG